MNDPHKFEHPTGFATFSDQYRERLFRAAHRITRSHEDAEDAVQDTLLRAFVHMDDFEGRSSFGTWLTRITINSAFMIRRKKTCRAGDRMHYSTSKPEKWSCGWRVCNAH